MTDEEQQAHILNCFYHNRKEHEDFENRMHAIESKLQEIHDLLKIGKAGLAFIRIAILTGASLAAIGTAVVQFWPSAKP